MSGQGAPVRLCRTVQRSRLRLRHPLPSSVPSGNTGLQRVLVPVQGPSGPVRPRVSPKGPTTRSGPGPGGSLLSPDSGSAWPRRRPNLRGLTPGSTPGAKGKYFLNTGVGKVRSFLDLTGPQVQSQTLPPKTSVCFVGSLRTRPVWALREGGPKKDLRPREGMGRAPTKVTTVVVGTHRGGGSGWFLGTFVCPV